MLTLTLSHDLQIHTSLPTNKKPRNPTIHHHTHNLPWHVIVKQGTPVLIIVTTRRLSMVIDDLHLPIPPAATASSIVMVVVVSMASFKLNVHFDLAGSLPSSAAERL